MKIKVILLMAIVAIGTINIYAHIAKTEVPQVVLDAFKKKYSDAKKAKWEKDDDNEYEVEFKLNKKEHEATFDGDGNWLETEIEISKKELPEAVLKAFTAKFPKAKFKEAEKVEKPTGVFYEIEFKEGKERKEALFDANGVYHEEDDDEEEEESDKEEEAPEEQENDDE